MPIRTARRDGSGIERNGRPDTHPVPMKGKRHGKAPADEGTFMQIFQLRDQLIRDYAAYPKSFIQIQDQRIREYVEQSLDAGVLWPEPSNSPKGERENPVN